MAVNNLSPAFVKIYLTIAGASHTMTLPVLAPAVFDPDPTVAALTNSAAGTDTFKNSIDALWATIDSFYHVADAPTLAELWSQPTPADDALLVCDYAPVTLAGTRTGANLAKFGIKTFTYRAELSGRGIFKIIKPSPATFTEGKYQRWGDDTGLLADEIGVRTFFASGINWITARNNQFYRTPLNVSDKTNDTLRKRAMRLGEIS